jgi:hypothetical protein
MNPITIASCVVIVINIGIAGFNSWQIYRNNELTKSLMDSRAKFEDARMKFELAACALKDAGSDTHVIVGGDIGLSFDCPDRM